MAVKKIVAGNVSVKVYTVDHATAKTGKSYILAYRDGRKRKLERFSTEADAIAQGRLKAAQLNAGRIEGAGMSLSDRDELQAARKLAGSTPLLAALKEWKQAGELTGGHLIAAAEAWQNRNSGRFTGLAVETAVDTFIKAKDRAGRQGERTYRAKLRPLATAFPGRTLDTLSATELTAYLEQFQDGVTRNDFRKRAVALFRWAQRSNHLPRGAALEIEMTDRATEKPAEIEIITPALYGQILEHVRAEHPDYLAAVALAGFCGIRSDEIHGKRADRSKRQEWADIHLADEKPFVRVTVAKKNTPSWRYVPLCDAAITWLKLCKKRKGPVCDAGAMERLRLLLREDKFELPENCFRHSFISYRVAITDGNKPQVASEAGNSVTQIDRHYRRPVTKTEAEAWFSIIPAF